MLQDEFEKEVNNLIEWCDDLDYEKYIDHWKKLATSAYSEVKLDVRAMRC